jgi:hypothetical protein
VSVEVCLQTHALTRVASNAPPAANPCCCNNYCCCRCCSYMAPVYASLALISEGRRFLMLDRLQDLAVNCPTHILHGVQVRSHT